MEIICSNHQRKTVPVYMSSRVRVPDRDDLSITRGYNTIFGRHIERHIRDTLLRDNFFSNALQI